VRDVRTDGAVDQHGRDVADPTLAELFESEFA
jgi:hypothetical protein